MATETSIQTTLLTVSTVNAILSTILINQLAGTWVLFGEPVTFPLSKTQEARLRHSGYNSRTM